MNALVDFSTKVRHDVRFSCDPLRRLCGDDAHFKHGACIKQFCEPNSLLFVDVPDLDAIAVDSDRARVVLVVGFPNKLGRADLRVIGIVVVSTYTASPNTNTAKVAVLDVHQFAAGVFGQPLCTLVASEMQRRQSVAIGHEQFLGQVITDVDRLVWSGLMCTPTRTLTDWGWIYRKHLGQRWSESNGRMIDVYEWRAYAEHAEKFQLRPQHNAPRHHNGQVRQTLYVRAFALPRIADRLGLTDEHLIDEVA